MQIQSIKNKVEIFLAMCIIALVYLPNLSMVEFHPDESQWIATSNVFETYLKFDFGSPLWHTSYWTLTQPPVVRYAIGLSRYLGGYRIPDLNKPWDFDRGTEFNNRQGAMPSPGLLWWSRLPMAILAIASFAMVFALLLNSRGRFAGYIWLALVLFNAYFLLQLRRAMGESCLLFFTVLGIYAVCQSLGSAEKNSGNGQRGAYIWLGVAGIAAGLAGASKLNGLANLAGIIVIAIVIALRSKTSGAEKLRFMLAGGGLASLACGVVFVAVNPFLWPNPIGRTILMFQHRITEMNQQTVTHPVDFISNWGQRWQVVPVRIFGDYALQIPLVLNLGLFIIGLGLLIYAITQWLQSKGADSTSFAWLIVALCAGIPPLFTSIDWDRYYLFPVFFSTLFGAIALGWICEQVFRRIAQKFFHGSLAS